MAASYPHVKGPTGRARLLAALCLALLLALLVGERALSASPAPPGAEVYTDHLRYYPGESVLITLPEGSYGLDVETPSASYRSVSAGKRTLGFMPREDGSYRVSLTGPDGAPVTEASFTVNGSAGPRIELEDRSGRPLPAEESLADSGRQRIVLRPGRSPLAGLREVKAGMPPEGRGYDITLQEADSSDVDAPPGMRVKQAFYLGKGSSENVTMLKDALGSALYRCVADPSTGVCLAGWERVRALAPGVAYEVEASAGLELFAEAGLSTVNTDRPMYHPGETATLWVVVLDSGGFPVSGAEVFLRITDPAGASHITSTRTGDIAEVRQGVYESRFRTALEGEHTILALARTAEGESSIESTFQVRAFFEFDILRLAPVVIDPWSGPFESAVRVEPFISVERFDVVETLPRELTVTDAGGAALTSDGTAWRLFWSGVLPGQTVRYAASAPLVSPVMYELGPLGILYGGGSFTEARSWLIAVDPPPQEYGIAGWIFRQDGVTQVPLNTSYSINDTTSGFYLENVTRIPFPGYSGRYSETLTGNTGDTIIVRAWNSTHFGNMTLVLTGDMDNVNVTLDRERPGVPDATAIIPLDSAVYQVNDSVLIQANITVPGPYDAVGCNATVSFSSPGVITLDAGQNATQLLGTLASGSATLVNWSATAASAGTTDITVTAVCDDQGSGFPAADSDTASDIHVSEAVPPEPHGIAGWIFGADGATQAPLGTSYLINDTTNGFWLRNVTRIPFPGYSGRYSETIQGNDGDNIAIIAWNATHYGNTSVVLLGDMEGVNVTLNTTRPSELNVTFIFPPNNSRYSAYETFANVTVNVSNIGGSEGVNCSVTLAISDTSIVNITPGENLTHELGNISVGGAVLSAWSVLQKSNGTLNFTANASCVSDGINFEDVNRATAENVTLEYLPDLFVNESSIVFGDTSPQENVTLHINATVLNLGNRNASDVLVQFFVDNLTNQLGNATVNVSAFSNATVNVTWLTVTGTHEIFVLVDPLNAITEANETNNNASRNITILAWQIYYGVLDGEIVLSDAVNLTTLRWNSSRGGNIFVVETGSLIDFSSLVPIGRNTGQGVRFEDFAEMDSALNMTAFNDSVNRTFTEGNAPKALASFFVYGANVSNVSVVNTTNTSTFRTGILWDSSDDLSLDLTYDAADREELVFITEISKGGVGAYGTYDYEVRVPAALREYRYAYGTLSFYVELR